ncbi:MAG: hypothetical protein ACI9P7_000671 [Candidatus Azotimanducaceae bacterium]|jgi:hypothetical protein
MMKKGAFDILPVFHETFIKAVKQRLNETACFLLLF